MEDVRTLKMPVLVEGDAKPTGTLAARGGPRVLDIDVSRLQDSIRKFREPLRLILQDLRSVGEMSLKQVQIELEVTAEGGIALIGSAKAGLKGGITLTFEH